MSNAETLSVTEAAVALGVSERTVRRRIARGQLPAQLRPGAGGGTVWEIERAAIAPPVPDERGQVAALVPAAGSAELARLEGDVREIKAFLAGQIAQRESDIARALEPLAKRLEILARENESLKTELAATRGHQRPAWWKRLRRVK
jgi:excisionase family DNA binding protein